MTDLAGVDGNPHLLLGMVVVGADGLVIEEGEHLVTVATQAFDEAFGVGVGPWGGDELVEAPMQLGLSPRVALGLHGGARLAKADRIFEQPGEFFAEASPRACGGEFIDLFELREQMEIALLFGERIERVVGTPEVGNQDAGKQRAEHRLDDARTAMRIDQIVALVAGGEGPQPARYTVDAPARLVGMQDRAVADGLADALIVAFQAPREVRPCESQAAGAHREAERGLRDLHTVADAHADEIMQPCRVDHEAQAQGAMRQGRRHRRGDDFAAGGTPMTVHGVGGDLGHHGWDLFDDPGVLADRGSDFMVTVRAVRKLVFEARIDARRRRPMRPRMSGLAPRWFGAPARARLQIHRLHPRGGGGTDRGSRSLGLQLVPTLGLLSQGKDGARGLRTRRSQDGERLGVSHGISPAVNGSRQ